MKLWLALLIAVPITAIAETRPVDILVNFEAGSHGDNLTAAYLNSVTFGSGLGAWSSNNPGPVAFTVSTSYSTTNLCPIWVRGTVYKDTSSDTRGAVMDTAQNQFNYYGASFSSTHNNVTMCYDLKLTTPFNDYKTYDLPHIMAGSQEFICQINGAGNFQAHTGSPSHVGSVITRDADTSIVYRIVLNYVRNGTCTAQVWNLGTGALVGSSTVAEDSNTAAAGVRIICDGHAEGSAGAMSIDNITLDWTTPGVLANLGVGPHAPYYVRTDGNDGNTGLGNSSGAAWLTIAKAASIMSPGDVARVQAGTYNETGNGTITLTADGVSGAPITYVADGAAITRRWYLNAADYTRVIGFEITHASDIDTEPVLINGGTGVQILDNNIHDTSHSGQSGGITLGGNTRDLVIRGNTIARPGVLTYAAHGTYTTADAIAASGSWGATNVLIEYNFMSHVADYVRPTGRFLVIRNNVLGPTTTDDFGGTPHVDGVQPVDYCAWLWFENNWHVENPIDDSHIFLAQYGYMTNAVLLGNVSIRSGDSLNLDWMNNTNFLAAHNIITDISCGPNRQMRNWHAWTFNYSSPYSTGIEVCRNNIFTNVTTSADGPYAHESGQLTHDHDMADRASDIPGYASFVNYAAPYDMRPTVSSPAVDAGGALTTAVGSGTGQTIQLLNPFWVYDGFGVTRGMRIYVGANNNLLVTNVNYATSNIMVSTSITWSDGANVGLAYRGSAPDVGAYEYGDTLLTSATISSNSLTYTVTPNGDTRFVVFYEDGLPQTPVYDSPYTYASAGGTVSAKAFALHAETNQVVTAAEGEAPSPPAPTTLRANAVTVRGTVSTR